MGRRHIGVTSAITAGRSIVLPVRSVGHRESENHGYDICSEPTNRCLADGVSGSRSGLGTDVLAMEEGRPSRWKDGLTRSLVHRSPIDNWKDGSKLPDRGVLGPISKDWAVFS